VQRGGLVCAVRVERRVRYHPLFFSAINRGSQKASHCMADSGAQGISPVSALAPNEKFLGLAVHPLVRTYAALTDGNISPPPIIGESQVAGRSASDW